MHKHLLVGTVGLLALFASSVQATVVTYDINTAYSGAQSAGTAPYIQIQFDDAVVPGSVRLTASAPGLDPTEWVARLNLNLDPALDPTDLFFGNFVINAGTMLQPVIFRGNNFFEADAGGFFDLQFEFSVSGGGFTRRWNQGESFSFDISGPAGLNANSFEFFSTPPATSGVQLLSTLIQGIGPLADEGFHSVPEPGIASLALLAGALAGRHRRKIRVDLSA